MAQVKIPTQLAQAQARALQAFEAVAAHRRQVGLPGLEWPPEERQRSEELMQAAIAAADGLRTALDASGLIAEHGSATVQPALMQAARDHLTPSAEPAT